MKIKINNISSYRSPESCTYTVDDRIERIQLNNGNTVQDYGHIASGDYFTLTCLFSKANFDAVMALWNARTPITFTDESGQVWQGMRLVIRKWQYQPRFPGYIMLEFEIWRV